MEGSAALPQDQASDQSAVLQREVIKLKNRVFFQEGQRAVLEFHFRAAIVGGQNVALTNGKVQLRGIPVGFGIRQRVAVRFCGKTHIAAH